MRSESTAKQFDTGADDLLQRLPFVAQGDIAGIETSHVEQIADQPGQTRSLFVHRLGSFQGRGRERRLDQR